MSATQNPLVSLPPLVAEPPRGPRAAEVACLLGDTVVAVKHVTPPASRARQRATRLLVGAGAALLVVAALTFGLGVRSAARDRAARAVWLDSGHRPAFGFRPERLGAAYDVLALGGLLTGLCCIGWALARRRQDGDPSRFAIGRAPGCDAGCEATPLARFPLVEACGDELVLRLTPEMRGERVLAGATTSLVDLAAAARRSAIVGAVDLPIEVGARYRIELGGQRFLVAEGPAPRPHALGGAGPEGRVIGFLAGSALVHLAVLALISSIPPDGGTLATGDDPSYLPIAWVHAAASEAPVPPPEPSTGGDTATPKGGDDAGAAMAGAAGTMGKHDATRPDGKYMIAQRADHETLAEARMHARTAGIIGLYRTSDSAFQTLTSTEAFASGLGDRDVEGGLTGADYAEAAGGWGYTEQGFGPGGDGNAWGTIGVSKFGLLGHQGMREPGFDTGHPGGPGMVRHAGHPPEPKMGPPGIIGDMDRDIIRRYVRRKLPRIRNCYERALLGNDHLAGTVEVSFQISPNGTVQGAAATGLNHEVDDCVGEAITSIQFPVPNGGGYVNVKYPFTFEPAG